MKKKKKKDKKEKKKKPEQKTEKEKESEKEKAPEESELVEDIKEEAPEISRFSEFVEVKPSAPVLEREIKEPEATLEQEIGFTPKKQEPEVKYEEAVGYDIESKYQESLKREREITPDMVSQVAPVREINLERVGRETRMPGQEFHMMAPAEMPSAPKSQEEYDIIPAKKSKKFRGETTAFQENLERRYEHK